MAMNSLSPVLAMIGIALAVLMVGLFPWLKDDIDQLDTRLNIISKNFDTGLKTVSKNSDTRSNSLSQNFDTRMSAL